MSSEPFVDFGRDICADISAAEQREWLVTNGIGGFASGTVAGLLSRRYHGLLVAAVKPPRDRMLLVTKIDETAEYDASVYELGTNRWADGTIAPHGYRHIERFRLEGTIPVWTFACADALIRETRGRRVLDQRLGRVSPELVAKSPRWVTQLVLAAHQFIVEFPDSNGSRAHSVIAGYPWFADWGRDTMIALPGLTLVTGRPEIARSVLSTHARFIKDGMLPNYFRSGGEPEYNTVDAALWFVEAVRQYDAITHDGALIRKLFPVLSELVNSYSRGTRFNIHADPEDGLLYAGEPGSQVTWMDAKVEDIAVTPRIGKPVEVNALWFNALCTMTDLARKLRKGSKLFSDLRDRVQESFQRFWNEQSQCCFDVIDGPEGNDNSLRPNQIFAVSLEQSPLTPSQQEKVVDICARRLLTSYGLRTVDPTHPQYRGHCVGPPAERDRAYHQGTVWGWLLGPFVLAHLRVHQDAKLALSFLEPIAAHIKSYGLGTAGEIFDGDPPFLPRGCIAQAWTVAEILRAWTACQRRL